MVKNLEAVLEANGWLDSQQFGFILRCETENALNCLAQVVCVAQTVCGRSVSGHQWGI